MGIAGASTCPVEAAADGVCVVIRLFGFVANVLWLQLVESVRMRSAAARFRMDRYSSCVERLRIVLVCVVAPRGCVVNEREGNRDEEAFDRSNE
jgi:hypothetical protein